MFRTYFTLECKRFGKVLPKCLLVNLLAVCLLALLVLAQQSGLFGSPSVVTSLQIGVAYDQGSELDREFIGFGLQFLTNSPSLKGKCTFLEVSEAEGLQQLEAKKLDAVLLVPEHYIQSLYDGTEEPVTLRFGTAQSGISSLLFRQLADALSEYMMQSKAGIYTMQDLYANWGEDYVQEADALTGAYLWKIANREGLLKTENISLMSHDNPLLSYLVIGFVLLFCLCGLNLGSVLGKEERMLQELLARRGLSKSKQYLAKLGSVCLLFAIPYTILYGTVGILAHANGISADYGLLYAKLLPILVLLSALCLCIYEAFSDGISGMLCFFFGFLLLAFLSGFFYPLSYFPEWMQTVAAWLPTKVMADYLTAGICGDSLLLPFAKTILLTALFVGLYPLLLALQTRQIQRRRFAKKGGAL